MLVVFSVVFGSTTIYEVERHAQPEKFSSFADAVWWTVVTLTTVGYGDLYPITRAGRLIAIVIVISGLGLFGTFVSLIGGAFMKAIHDEEADAVRDFLSPRSVRPS